jgi:hypothetical protein
MPVLWLDPISRHLAIVAKRVTAWQEIIAVSKTAACACRKNHVVKNVNVADMPIGALTRVVQALGKTVADPALPGR